MHFYPELCWFSVCVDLVLLSREVDIRFHPFPTYSSVWLSDIFKPYASSQLGYVGFDD